VNISLQNLGKRYRFEWIFKDLTIELQEGQGYAILGSNGSGKSTLMQVLSGYLSASRGKITYSENSKVIEHGKAYEALSFAAPYIDLIEEFTLQEVIDFHWNFKSMLLSKKELIDLLGYPKSAFSKQIKYFSSGMQQRLKLGLAICSDTSLLLLDEPTITLDQQAVAWYVEVLRKYAYSPNRLTIIASNVEEDFQGCQHRINILDYKKKGKK
jgi:ABC-type multidrug transport system ATPase subunit